MNLPISGPRLTKMAKRLGRPARPEMDQEDWSGAKHRAQILAEGIQIYWHEKGYYGVECKVVNYGNNDHPVWGVRSNIAEQVSA